jgi:hypothetical protein
MQRGFHAHWGPIATLPSLLLGGLSGHWSMGFMLIHDTVHARSLAQRS